MIRSTGLDCISRLELVNDECANNHACGTSTMSSLPFTTDGERPSRPIIALSGVMKDGHPMVVEGTDRVSNQDQAGASTSTSLTEST